MKKTALIFVGLILLLSISLNTYAQVEIFKATSTLWQFDHRIKHLSSDQIALIENIEGVQKIDPYQKYQITVWIGRAFDWEKDGIKEGIINAIEFNR